MAYIPMSYFVALGVSMAIEYPMVSLERLLASKAARSDDKVVNKYNISNALSPRKSFSNPASYNLTVFDNANQNDNKNCGNNHNQEKKQITSVFNHLTKLPSINRVKSATPPRFGTVSQVVSFDREED